MTRTEKTTALSRLKTGAGRVDTFIVLEMASGIWAAEGEPFFVFMADERDGVQQLHGIREAGGKSRGTGSRNGHRGSRLGKASV